MRNNLVLQFYCSECGALLDIKRQAEQTVKCEFTTTDIDNPPLPTGGCMEKVPGIQVVPCRKCITKYTGPAKAMVLALKDMQVI